MTYYCYGSKEGRRCARRANRERTGVHIAASSACNRIRRNFRSLAASIAILLVLGACPHVSRAQSNAGLQPSASSDPKAAWTYYGLSKWHIDKRDPERSIPSPEQRDANPIEFGYFLMDVSDLAELAVKHNNHVEAITYFKMLAKAVPEKAVSYRKVCISYQALGDWQNALAFCKEALSKEGTFVEDFSRYSQIMLQMKPNFTSEDGADLDGVAEHLRAQMPDDTLADEITCDVGLKLQDNNRMRDCTAWLAAKAPDSAKTLTYQWAYALQRGDMAAARSIIDKAKRLSVSPAVIRTLEGGMVKFKHSDRLGWLHNRWVRLGVLTLALGILAVSFARRRQRPAPATS